MKITYILSILGLFISINANAQIYLEPYVGYSMGNQKTDLDVTSTVNIKAKQTGTSSQALYGGRLGYSFLTLAVGGEYMGGTIATSSDNDITTAGVSTKTSTSGTAGTTNIGAFVALNFPILRAFATYFPSSKLDTDTSGSGFKVGLGFYLLPMLALNAEYMSFTYNKYEPTGLTVNSFSSTADLYMISLSAPLSF